MNYRISLFGTACFSMLTLCCQEKELMYSPLPEIDPYVQRFQKEALQRGVHIDLYEEGLVINFETLPQGKAGSCRPNDFPKQVTIDPSQWEKLDNPQREVLVFHELGHCILNRDHNNNLLPFGECASMMDGNDEEGGFICSNNYYTPQWRQYYLDELFDPDTSVPSWYQIPDINNLNENLRYKQSKKDTCFICTPLRNFYRVFDTVKLQEQENFLMTMTYQHRGFEEALKFAWNNILFSYFPSKNRVEIVKSDLSQFDKNQLLLLQYSAYPNNTFYRKDQLPGLNFPISLNILRKDSMLYFYLNKHPVHVMEYSNQIINPELKNSEEHSIMSNASREPNITHLIVNTF